MNSNSGQDLDNKSLDLSLKLLVSNNFIKSPVVLILSHSKSGALGIALNQNLGLISFDEIFKILQMPSNIVEYNGKTELFLGGSFERNRCFILHSNDYKGDTMLDITCDISLSSNNNILKEIARGKGPKHKMIAIGISKWKPGELETDLFNNNWVVCDPNKDLIFSEDKDKWMNIFSSNGLVPMSYIHRLGTC